MTGECCASRVCLSTLSRWIGAHWRISSSYIDAISLWSTLWYLVSNRRTKTDTRCVVSFSLASFAPAACTSKSNRDKRTTKPKNQKRGDRMMTVIVSSRAHCVAVNQVATWQKQHPFWYNDRTPLSTIVTCFSDNVSYTPGKGHYWRGRKDHGRNYGQVWSLSWSISWWGAIEK